MKLKTKANILFKAFFFLVVAERNWMIRQRVHIRVGGLDNWTFIINVYL